jgi:cobalt-zinc-cadmium efflux system outer membrane protein
VSSYELKIHDARVLQAGLGPNPELTLTAENFAGSGEAKGTKLLETTLSLGQTIELGGKRGSRITVANIDRELSGIDRQARQLDVLAEVTRKFIDAVAAQQVLELSQHTRQLAQQTLSVIEKRVQAARTPLAEQSRATIALTRARIAEQQAALSLDNARHELAAMWGGDAPAFSRVNADLFLMPSLQSYEQLQSQLQASPDLLRFATEARLREAEWKLAQSQARSDLNVSAGVRHLQASGDYALVAQIAMPLPFANRNQGTIQEAQVKRDQLRVQSRAALIHAQTTLYRLYQQIHFSQEAVAQLRKEAIPQAEAAVAQTRDGYERGRFSYLELATAQQDLFELQRAAIDVAADYHRLFTELERLTCEPLAATSN